MSTRRIEAVKCEFLKFNMSLDQVQICAMRKDVRRVENLNTVCGENKKLACVTCRYANYNLLNVKCAMSMW